MIILSIGTDRKLFDPFSAVRGRMIEYGTLFTELHIIVFSLVDNQYKTEQIAPNVWIYPTNARSKIDYIFKARTIGKKILAEKRQSLPHENLVVTAQDPFETGLAAWLITKKLSVKLHMQIHTDFLSPYFKRVSWLNRIRVRLARFLLPKADGIRAVSGRIQESLQKIDPALPEKTIVLPIFTNREDFKNSPVTIDLHKRYPQFSFIILMASRLTNEKNIGFALAVMREVVIKHKDAGLIIVGEGPDKKYLQGLALQYHLDRNVVFESWQESLASYYHTANVFLTTSFFEGYGLTLVEAAASGCPIIASDVGIAKEIIKEGTTGFVIDTFDKKLFVEKLLLMIEQKDVYSKLKRAAGVQSRKKQSDSHADYLKKYQEMLEKLSVAP